LSSLPEETKKYILGALMFLASVVTGLGFSDRAGIAGSALKDALFFLIGKGAYLVPFIFALISLWSFFLGRGKEDKKVSLKAIGTASLILILGFVGFSAIFERELRHGGWLGYIISQLPLKFLGGLVTKIVFLTAIFLGLLIFKQFLSPRSKESFEEDRQKTPLIKKILTPTFRVSKIESDKKEKSFPTLLPKETPLSKGASDSELSDGKLIFKPFPINLLEADKGKPNSGNIKENSFIIKKTLENFGIEVAMASVNTGPTVAQYTFRPAEGVKLSKITTLSNNLSLALAAHPIRIEAPIPGKPLVGIEVPNRVRTTVRLRNLIADLEPNGASGLEFVLGRDVSGEPVFGDLARMPHLLVAGSTGSGKTIFLNCLIMNLLYRNGPGNLRFILVDPKRVEFPVYNGIPHLLCPVVLNASQTVNVLKWLIAEMERRFDVLSEAKTRDIKSYNARVLKSAKEGEKKMPYIVLVIDELADLMAAQGRDVEAGIVRLAQMARAVGIHLVVATQRPSVDVITGLIKANIVSRVSFQVASHVDSRTVLDMAGAERLLGRGDMLYISAEITKPKRIQAAFVSEEEVKKVIKYIKSSDDQGEIEPVEEEEGLKEALMRPVSEEKNLSWTKEGDSLYEQAKEIVILSNKASASLLQRKLQIGYPRAARLIDVLEQNGLIGPQDGTKPREVYNIPPKDGFEQEEIDKNEEDWEDEEFS